jgi:PAS domain S-box-containing protein
MPVTERQYADVIATQMVKLFRPPFACYVDQWMQTKKGLRCISWSAKSVRDGSGAVTSIVAVGRDLTSLKKKEKALKKRDRELMLVVESDSRMYYTHSPDQVLDYVSPRIRDLLGIRTKTGKRLWTDYLSENPVNAAGLERTLRAVSSGRREPPYRLELVRTDGSRIWVEVNEIPIVRDGKTVAVAGSLVDVTEKMQIDEGMDEAEILIKASRAKNDGQDARNARHSPLGYFRSVFGRKEDTEEDDERKLAAPESGRK